MEVEIEKADSKEAMVKIEIPQAKIFFLP